MKPTTTTYLLIAAFALAFLLLWAGSVALVSWDSRRRRLGRWERWLSIALSVVLPIAGCVVYGLILLVAGLMKPGAPPKENPRHRVTQPMPAFHTPGVRTTVPGAEMLQDTLSYSVPSPPVPSRPTASRPIYQIIIVEGPNLGGDYRLERFPVGIGRSATAFVRLDKDPKVSRQHAEIYEEQEILHIRDLGSLHGTQVNGYPIKDQALRSGDRIRLGSSVLLFEASEE